jgi:GT2 family glycosyltransferase
VSDALTPGASGDEAPRISIVIPNLDGMEHLPDCFASLAAADYPPDRQEWILSDTGSRDGSLPFVRQRYPRTRIVENGRDAGFAGACNAGARVAGGEYVIFLNNDTRVDPAWLRGYLQALARDPEAVCAGSDLRDWNDLEIDFDGATSNLFGVGRPPALRGWPDSPAEPVEGEPLLFASGAAMIIRRAVFLEAGGFDPTYFAYFEDFDLGWRLWVLGHRVVFAPASRVYHKGGGTAGATRAPSHRRYALFEANTLATIIKNYEQGTLDRVLPAALLLEWKRALLAAGDSVDPDHYRLGGARRSAQIEEQNVATLPRMSVAHLLAFGRLADRLPHLLAERARIQAARRRPDSAILPLFRRPFGPQFAGPAYADAMRRIAAALDLYPVVAVASPSRILLCSPATGAGQERAAALTAILSGEFLVAEAGDNRAHLAATADLLLGVGDALADAAGLAPDVPLAADVSSWDPGALPTPARKLLEQRAGLLICADPAAADAWRAALPAIPVVVQPPGAELAPALRHYCRYPLIGH